MSRLSEDIHELFTDEILKSLFSVNIFTINDFLRVDIKKITTSSGLSYKDVIYLKKHIANKHAAVTRNGLKYYKEILAKSAIISSGIKSLDILLDGGFLTGQLYEICGLPASGKTQLCLTIAKHTGVSHKKVYYLDSKMDFTGRRLKEMLENTRNVRESQIPDIMSNILVMQINSRYDLISGMYKLKEYITQNLNVRVIIVDSLPALFHDGLANFGETNSMLNQFANIARFLAVECHLVVITTNILTTWFEGDFKTQNNSALVERICLGKYWLTVPNQRLMVKRKGNTNECIIKSYNCDLNSLEKHCDITLGAEGVT